MDACYPGNSLRRLQRRIGNTTRLLLREPSLLTRGPIWWWRLLRQHKADTAGRPWVLVDPSLADVDYREWIHATEAASQRQLQDLLKAMESWPTAPEFTLLLPLRRPLRAAWLWSTIASVRAQRYTHWRLFIITESNGKDSVWQHLNQLASVDPRIKLLATSAHGRTSLACNQVLDTAHGSWLGLLDQGDQLSGDALAWMAAAIREHPQAQLFYSDTDKISAWGQRQQPHFKCAWNPSLQEGINFFGQLGIYNSALLRQVGGFREACEAAQAYDMVLRCMAEISIEQVIHIPRILYHQLASSGASGAQQPSASSETEAARRALCDHYRRLGIDAEVQSTPIGLRTRLALPPQPPWVTIVVPTRNGRSVLEPCLSSILTITDYSNLDLLLVDNGSDEPATLAYLEQLQIDPRVRIRRDPRPFNYSALNNAAVAEARGEFVLLLNNDIEAIAADWLQEMMVQALRPGIGAVGAKLLFPDLSIQHAGVFLGLGGIAAHGHRGYADADPGSVARTALVQDVSVVTGACLLVRRSLYQSLGGLNEELAVAFNDVDFCLRLRQAGYRNIYTPHARLIHHESVSRGQDSPASERFKAESLWMIRHWGELLQSDPAYNPHLTLAHADFSLPWPPRPQSPPRLGSLTPTPTELN